MCPSLLKIVRKTWPCLSMFFRRWFLYFVHFSFGGSILMFSNSKTNNVSVLRSYINDAWITDHHLRPLTRKLHGIWYCIDMYAMDKQSTRVIFTVVSNWNAQTSQPSSRSLHMSFFAFLVSFLVKIMVSWL